MEGGGGVLGNITMGQYYPVDSPVHRLDPRVKLILTLVFIIVVFLVKTLAGYALLLVFLYGVARCARVPFKMLLKGLRPLRMILVLTFLLNLFFTPGENVLLSFWIIRITSEALQAVMDFFFDAVEANRVAARHDQRNPRSGMVMQKCGMRYEGTLRSAVRSNRGLGDACCYALLRGDR